MYSIVRNLSVILALALCSCGQNNAQHPSTRNLIGTAAVSAQPTLTVHVSLAANQPVYGDFSVATFRLDTAHQSNFLAGRMECLQIGATNQMQCTSFDPLTKLQRGNIYRLILTSHYRGGILCSVFMYQAQATTEVTMDIRSTGECILAQLKQDTNLSEVEIKQRIQLLMGTPDTKDYDLVSSAYDALLYFGADKELVPAWIKLVNAVKANRPLSRKNLPQAGVLRLPQ